MRTGLVLGFFDGVHKAHCAVLNSALKKSDCVTVVTLKDSPSLYFNKSAEYILSRKNSFDKMLNMGVNKVVELDFSKISHLNPKEYLEYLVQTYKPVLISTGFNHTFGVNKSGNSDFLSQNAKIYNYEYMCVPPVVEDGEIISSTLIKKYLKEGNIKKANFLLGSNFILEGNVIHGAMLGRTIGFPTANIKYPENIVKIPYGVYGVNVKLQGKEENSELLFKGVMNWGVKPTVNKTSEPLVEVHIIDYNENLYGNDIKIEVLNQIRKEKKFSSLEELKNQINEDVKLCSEL